MHVRMCVHMSALLFVYVAIKCKSANGQPLGPPVCLYVCLPARMCCGIAGEYGWPTAGNAANGYGIVSGRPLEMCDDKVYIHN